MQPSGTKPTPTVYDILALYKSDIRPTSGAYMQPSRTRPIPAVNTIPKAYIQFPGTESTRGVYMQLSRPTSAAYIQASDTEPPLADLGIGPIYVAYTPPLGTEATPANYM